MKITSPKTELFQLLSSDNKSEAKSNKIIELLLVTLLQNDNMFTFSKLQRGKFNIVCKAIVDQGLQDLIDAKFSGKRAVGVATFEFI